MVKEHYDAAILGSGLKAQIIIKLAIFRHGHLAMEI
jgi:hypothetical protein